jgi:ankyrin repeat protein
MKKLLFFLLVFNMILFGADTNNRNAALYRAVQRNNPEKIQLLLAQGANPNVSNEYGYTPLYWAANYNPISVVELLLAHGANPNIADHDGQTPLYRAVLFGKDSIVELLLAHGANPNIADVNERTPLSLAACSRDLTNIIECLINHITQDAFTISL